MITPEKIRGDTYSPSQGYEPAISYGRQLLNEVLRGHVPSHTLRIRKNGTVYLSGDEDQAIYLIVSGKIKLVVCSPSGQESLLAILSIGDLFGESCLAQSTVRLETAIAIEGSLLKRVSVQFLIKAIQTEKIQVCDLLHYLVERNVEQQVSIVNLLTLNSQTRLGMILSKLARKFGRKTALGLVIPLRVSQEELAQMVGTTRPRISTFMNRFQRMGLIDISIERFIIIKETAMADYLSRPW